MISGICIPCKSILEAAYAANNTKQEKILIKMGKQAGIWYVVMENLK